jgi:hypothetical protein
MPTKKRPSGREQEIANKKNHPVAKSNRPKISQNAEAQPAPKLRESQKAIG